MLTLNGKDFLLVRHGYQGAIAEGLDEREVYDIVGDHAPAPRLHEKQETHVRRGSRTIIVRWIEREHAYYVLNVSATGSRH